VSLATADPLGIGGLLSDASRVIRMAVLGWPVPGALPETLLDATVTGLDAFTGEGSLELPARHRLAFREFGLSIGLAGVEQLPVWIGKNPELFDRTGILRHQIQALAEYVPLREEIEQFWLDGTNRESATWTEHREINTVMLATSLAPDGFLEI